jgi:hypothetical protein
MKPRPPLLAGWLLEHLAQGPHRDSLIGDLDEHFARGRSSAWYWREVLAAILAGAARDIRDHKLRALGAALLVWVMIVPWVEITWALYLLISDKWANAAALKSWTTESKAFFRFWILFGGGLQFVWCTVCAVAGWVNVRLQRDRPATILVVSVATEVPLVLWWGLPLWLRVDSLPTAYSIPMGVTALVILIGMPAATLVGAVHGTRISPRSLRSLR